MARRLSHAACYDIDAREAAAVIGRYSFIRSGSLASSMQICAVCSTAVDCVSCDTWKENKMETASSAINVFVASDACAAHMCARIWVRVLSAPVRAPVWSAVHMGAGVCACMRACGGSGTIRTGGYTL